jgi:hypothetical protein
MKSEDCHDGKPQARRKLLLAINEALFISETNCDATMAKFSGTDWHQAGRIMVGISNILR